MLILRLIRESFLFALQSLLANKLRTMLSLLGITIGIFAIIMIFSVVDSLEYAIRKSVSGLGDRVVYVQKWPWGPEEGAENYAWWKFFNRPEPNYREFKRLQQVIQDTEALAFMFSKSGTMKYGNNLAEQVMVSAVSDQFQEVWLYPIREGRYFSEIESQSGRPVVLLGASLADGLFPNEYPIGKSVKLWGRPFTVIGVYEAQGSSLLGNSPDQNAYIPLEYGRRLYSDQISGTVILAKAKSTDDMDLLVDELRAGLRAYRRIKPGLPDTFSFNRISLVAKALDDLFSRVRLAGLLIGGFSILVGGFGIANIMFVSVKERTSQIGIQKALGAKNYFILLQFLTEAVVLSLIGGLIGLLLVYGLLRVAATSLEFDIFLSASNIAQGVWISVLIGLISGIFPALSAARMAPVDAIRSGQ
jgi:putative ABC transport system permease protein